MPICRKTLDYRKENNLCPRCGQNNADEKSMCLKHLEQFAEKTKKIRHKRISNNQCPQCRQIKQSNKYYCNECIEKNKPKSLKCYHKRCKEKIENHQCIVCSINLSREEIGNEYRICYICRTKISIKERGYRKNRIENNLCIVCGKHQPNKGKRCDECKNKRSNWYKTSPTRKNDHKRLENQRKMVFNHYGNMCACCGETVICFLSIDHIKNDGNEHRKSIKKKGSHFYKWLIENNFPEGFQTLCMSCNFGRYRNGGICPHQQNKIPQSSIINKGENNEILDYR